jgi:hypothetical protein
MLKTEKMETAIAKGGVAETGETAHFGFARVAAAGSAVVLACLMLVPLLALREDEAGGGTVALLIATALIFGFALVIVLQRLQWRGAVLSVGPAGICDRRIGPGFIPWEQVREIFLFRARSQFYLAVIPDEADAFIDPPGPLFAFFIRANSWLRMPLFSISLTGLDAPRRQIVNALRAHLPAHLADDGVEE